MPLLNNILQWSTALPAWQRDALRRLFQQELTPQDYEDLYAMLKAAHGIPDQENRQPVPLAAEHLPAKVTGGTVILKAMHDLLHVNRIVSGQTLNYSPTGITVIYGPNGSGKSGYSRVLKRACRARDQSEDILTDATNPAETNSTPEATFDIAIDTSTKSIKWLKGTASPDELSTIAVFDAHCARAYLREGEAAYLPYGMDIVVNLADKVIPELNRRLKKEISGVNVDISPFNHLRGETAVGKVIAGLCNRRNPAEIRELAALSETEISRIITLEAVLHEADPKIKADEHRLSAGRIKEIAIRIDSALKCVKDESVNQLKTYYDAALTAEEAEKTAALSLRSGESLLPGTGEKVWKLLFDAARKFSTEVAYRGRTFPYTDNGAVCPLCQQPLTDEGERLKRFEKYIQDDAAKTATDKRLQLDSETDTIKHSNVTIGLNIPLEVELSQLDKTVVSKIKDFEVSIETRRSWMLNAVTSHSWDNMPQFSENPQKTLRGLAAKQLLIARTFKKATNTANRCQLKSEYDELVARRNLKASLEGILALVERVTLKVSLENCNNELSTRRITEKSKDLAENVITPALEKALGKEFEKLGIGYIRTILKERPEKGTIHYSLLLNLPTNAKLENVLSEGEQRAIAIGSFLAELQLADHKGAIVFDDPVSSLDHERRILVAKRIVVEAAQRQVVVFTHDTVFLGELLDQIEHQGISNLIHHLEWTNDIPGYVNEGLPWDHKGYKDRINFLKQNCSALEKTWPLHPNDTDRERICQQYSWLRATIERVIQDVLFNGVVKRYRDWIRVDHLDGITVVTDANCNEIKRLHKRCCDFTQAHDPSSAKNAPPPTPTELSNDIVSLESVIQTIKDARK